jgi:signal transduction histidine kinase
VLVLLLAAWMVRRPPRREALTVAPLALAAALLLLAAWWLPRLPAPTGEAWRAAAEERYARLWERLGTDAAEAARVVAGPPRNVAGRLEVHRQLGAVVGRSTVPRLTLFLVDPDGRPLLWEGAGLLHEMLPGEVPRQGRDFRASFGSATLIAVVPLDGSARPWRILAGASFDNGELPFAAPGWVPGDAYRWAPLRDEAQAAAGSVLLRPPGVPPLAAQPRRASPLSEAGELGPRLAWLALALALCTLAAMRGVGLAVLSGTAVRASHPAAAVAALGVGALVAGGLAGNAPAGHLGTMLLGLALATAGWRLGGRRRRPVMAAAWGAAGALALAAAALVLQHRIGPVDLASLSPRPDRLALDMGVLGAAAGLLALGAGAADGMRVREGGRPAGAPREWRLAAARGRLAGAAAGLLLAAGTAHERPALALPLLAAGGAAAALWLRRSDWRRDPWALVPLALLAALLGGVAWQAGYRLALRHEAEQRLLAAMAPPTRAELDTAWEEITARFAAVDLTRFSPRSPRGLAVGDLAYLLWRRSPLARRNSLTALVVLPEGGAPLQFSYGLPLDEAGEVDDDPVRWGTLGPATWRDLVVAGELPLRSAGRRWGTVRVFLLPQPGFRLDRGPVEYLTVGLLRGGPEAGLTGTLPRELRYALYATGGAPLVSPWRETPRLPARLLDARQATVATPEGPAWAVRRQEPGGVAVLFLPLLDGWSAAERVGLHALALLLVALALATLASLLALTRASFRDLLRRAVRSYSKRLLLVYGALLLAPLLLLDLLLFRNLGERMLAEQRAAGEAAVRSAQQVLGEYVMSLEPGFGIETELDDELLVWLSRVLHHEVNLYWGSSINASSKRELFTAGLLPARIPGEVHARLVLLGHDLAWRTSRAGDTGYLELYAPLRVPGAREGEPQLFLSMPLLAQQEELAAELAELRRRSLLLTAALFLFAAAVGTRLARTFTRPLQQLVEGTRRIAQGATSLELAPSEQELAALVSAIDEMARRIAEGRQRLVREKEVVDRMVENITSGVVSLDHAGRVLLANRVAVDVLGTRLGEPLRDPLGERPELAPVAEFLAGAGAEPAEATVRLTQDGDERELRLAWVPVPGAGEPSALLVLEDATEVLRAQRLEAWAEMARIIAHEIKNPLTPIRLSTEHMLEVHHRDPTHFAEVFERCSANILRQVDELQEIAQEFSTYSRIPRLDPRAGDLAAALRELVESYRTAAPPGVALGFDATPPSLQARFDERLLRRAVRNLIENSLRASGGRGEVSVRVEAVDGEASVAVADRGPGVSPDLLQRIFDPYFSTHDTGTGLGLPIARRIAEQHGGSIQARNRPDGGLEVVIRIPRS